MVGVDVADEARSALLHVRVKGSDAAPLRGALVQALSRQPSGIESTTVATGAEGECLVPRAGLGRIVVSAADHETVSLAPPPVSVPLLEVVLGPGGFLTGVTRDARSALPVRARIVAWPSAQFPPTPDLVERGRRGDVSVAYAESGEDGVFRIEGLHPEVLYSIMAAAPATTERSVIALPAPLVHRAPGSLDLDLQLVPLFGLEVRIREETGVGLATGAQLRPPHIAPIQPLGIPGVRFVFQPTYALELAGLSDAPRYGEKGRHVYLFTTLGDRTAVGPLDWKLHPTGCSPLEAELWGLPVTDHLHVEELDLICPGPLGSLRIELRQSPGMEFPDPDSRASDRSVAFSGTLHLEGQAGRYVFDVASFPLQLQGLPYGTYRIWYTTPHSSLLVPSPDRPDEYVTIGPFESRWELDLAQMARLHVEVTRADGSPFAGRVSLMAYEGESIGPGWEGVGGFQFLDGPPHELWPLRPGPLSLHLQSPLPAESGLTTVHLEPGQVSRVRISVK